MVKPQSAGTGRTDAGFLDAVHRSEQLVHAGDHRDFWSLAGAAETRIRKDLPIYILAGDADPLNHSLEWIKPLAKRYRAAGISNVTEKYYPGAPRHSE